MPVAVAVTSDVGVYARIVPCRSRSPFSFIFLRGVGGAYSEAGKKGVMGRDSSLALCAHFHHPLANILAFLDPNRTEKWQFCSEPVNRLPVPLASQPDFSVK